MKLLEGKTALITGAARGIGKAIALRFAQEGADIAFTDLVIDENGKKTEEEIKALGVKCKAYASNAADFAQTAEVVKEVVADFGRIDILVNNAGRSAEKPIEDTDVTEFDDIIKLNINAIFYCTKAVVPAMKKQGSGVILNTSSMVSIYGQPSGVGYPTSKFAVNGLTKSLARELAPSGIRVNAVAPGVTNTDMVAKLPPEVIEPLIKTIPLGRIGEPRDIANAFLFLASDLASYVTGEILSVDGAARS